MALAATRPVIEPIVGNAIAREAMGTGDLHRD